MENIETKIPLGLKALFIVMGLVAIVIICTIFNSSSDKERLNSNQWSTHINYDSVKHYQDSFDNTLEGKAIAAKERKILYNDSVKNAIQEKKDSIAEAKKHAKYSKIIAKFGCDEDNAELILRHRIWIGMTYEMLVYEFGRPNRINTSNYGSGNQYQAVWDDKEIECFYFKEDHIIYAYN